MANKLIKNENNSGKELLKEVHKPIIRNFNKIKVHALFIDDIQGVDLAHMQLRSKFNEGFSSSLCVIDIYNKYAWVIYLENKKVITITNAFQKVLKKSSRKSNKIFVNKGNDFDNRSMKPWLEKINIEMYFTNNERKFVVAEIFIKTLQNKIYEYMTLVSKNVYIDKLDDVVNKYNNTSQSTIKMKPVAVKSNTYIESSEEINNKIPKLKIGGNVRI